MTALVVNLDGVDPDDAFSVVPYEKGSTFLWYLEDTVGGPGTVLLLCYLSVHLILIYIQNIISNSL